MVSHFGNLDNSKIMEEIKKILNFSDLSSQKWQNDTMEN